LIDTHFFLSLIQYRKWTVMCQWQSPWCVSCLFFVNMAL